MAIYGRHREQWDPTKIKSKTSKNKTYSLEVTNQSIAGNSVTANPDSDTGTESAQNTTNWHWVSSASNTAGNDSGEDPKQPSSGVPINGGGTYENEIYPMGGGSGPTRLLAYKQAITGSRTVTFKILACGGGGGGVASRVFNPNGTNAGNAMGGVSTKEWLGAGTDPYRPIQLVYATDGFGHDANWQKVPGSVDIHGHGGSHPNVGTNNLTNGVQGFGTEFKPFTVEVSGIAGSYYLGVRQQTGGSQYNTWAIADLVITEPPRTIKRHKLTDTMFYRFFMNNEGDAKITAAERETRVSIDAFHLQGYRDQAITNYPSGWNPPSIDIDASRFGKAINFGTSANYSSTLQNQYNMIAQQAPTEWTLDQLFGDSGTYSEPGPRQIYFSFWFRRDTQNAVNDGHTFAMLAYEGNQNRSLPKSTDPRISFYCNSTGQMHMRFADETSDGSGGPGDKYVTIDGTPAFLQCGSDALRVGIGTWHYVTFAVKLTSGWDVDEIVDNTMIFIDGIKDPDPQTPVKRNKTAFTVGLSGDAIWEWNFGSLINSYGAYDSSDQTLRRSSGFKGALGEFTVITNSGSSDAERIEFAKFLYEASREGAHALHSGAHSSSPRLEQLDLDRDSAYPSNFTMNSYTKFSDSLQYASGRDPRVGLQPSDAFQEGYNTGETWKEKAGKYHIQSTVTSGTESVTVMPHLRLNPADTILTNGNWYSDARSEFFSEDLNATSGFVVSNTNDGASTKHVPIVSDELYREHISTDLPAFVESDMGEEFKDCFVIEIPLPHTGGSLKLSTDAEDTTGGVSNEIAMRRFNSAGPTGSTVDPVQKINTMAYYNFKDKKWEYTVPSYTTYSPDGQAGGLPWTGTGDIGFSPMSGLVFPKQGRNLDHFASLYGKPMTDCGFPFHKKFESEVGQTIDLSKYLDESVILEGWEIHCDVIPRVGYSHNITNGAAVNTEDGYSAVYPTMNKTPLYYGATGEAAVFWDPDAGETVPFYEKRFSDPGGGYYFNNTIPVSSFSSTYVTGSDGSVAETKTENKPNKLAKGLVTKGVTAFLLKETDLFDKGTQRQKWLRTQSRIITGNANDLGSGNSYRYDRGGSFAGSIIDYSGTHPNVIDSRTESSTPGLMFPPTSFEFYEPNTVRYSRGSSRELIGYLQQLYHNDPSGSLDRSYWAREEGGSTSGGIVPNWRTQESIVKLLNKENDVYVSNLLRENTDIHPLSVSGSCKIQTPYAGSFPISNFKITGNSGSTNSGTLGVYKHSLTAPETIDIHHAYGVIPSSEGSTFSEFIQHDTVPSIQGKDKAVSLELPESLYPAGIPQDNAADWATKVLSPFDVSIPQNEECDVVLRPTDKLILGIQDSISTTFASQQIQHNADGAQFVRWGRNYLELPDSQSGYLRLYVRRTRNDKTYNAIADESTYNANVSRDLGDHLIDDDYMVNPPLMYSGSMADDIVGPTTFTPPIIRMNVSLDSATENTNALSQLSFGPTGGGGALWNILRNNYENLGYWALRDEDGGNPAGAGGYHTAFPWGSLSAKVFKNRGQTTTPRKPAVDWHDPGGYTKDNRHWLNILEAYHWYITKQNPNASTGDFAHDHADISSLYGALATGNNPFRNQTAAYLAELNPNNGAPSSSIAVTAVGSDTVDKTIVGENCPAQSAWNLKVFLPMFLDGVMTARLKGVEVEFRLVKVDSRLATDTDGDGAVNGIRPTVTDGTGLKLGDVFYFNRSHETKILSLDKTSLVNAHGGENQQNTNNDNRWIRNAFGAVSNAKIILYIVAGEVKHSTGTYGHLTGFQTGGVLSFKQVYAIISRVLDIQCSIDHSILATVNGAWDGSTGTNYTLGSITVAKPDVTGFDSFSLSMPLDPVLREVFTSQKDYLNSLIDFKLCGLSMVGVVNDYPTGNFNDTQRSASDLIQNTIQDVLWLYDSGGSIVGVSGHNFGASGFGGMLTAGNFTQSETYWFGDYFRAWVATTRELDGLGSNSAAGKGTGQIQDNNSQFQNNSMYRINYQGLITTAPLLEITNETYNDTINRRIDRKVQRRTTSKLLSSSVGSPLQAGPFGSLKNIISLNSRQVLFDSLVPETHDCQAGYCPTHIHKTKEECNAFVGAGHADTNPSDPTGKSNVWVEEPWGATLQDIPATFPFETNEDSRKADISANEIKVKMKTATSGGPDTANTNTIDIKDTFFYPNGTYAWSFTTSSDNILTEGTLGFINITNYIQKDFKGAGDFRKKSVRDLFLGFGDGLQGKHLISPLRYEYKAFKTSSPYTPEDFAGEYQMHEPRGARYGLVSVGPSFGNYKFNYHRFGQLRDMLEQSIDTKFINHAQDERVFGSPVVVSPVNPINPEVPKLMENTSRYNKTANATVRKPFIESNYEATPQPVNLNSETLRVDVAGSIRTRGITAPGNIAANIRSRG